MSRSATVVLLLSLAALSALTYAKAADSRQTKAKREVQLLPSPVLIRVITDEAEAKRIADAEAA